MASVRSTHYSPAEASVGTPRANTSPGPGAGGNIDKPEGVGRSAEDAIRCSRALTRTNPGKTPNLVPESASLDRGGITPSTELRPLHDTYMTLPDAVGPICPRRRAAMVRTGSRQGRTDQTRQEETGS